MSTIDKQRFAAVVKLQALGYTFSLADGWTLPRNASCAGTASFAAEADALHAILMRRADALQGCTGGSPEEAELKAIADALEAYESQRWPDGKEPGGKG